MPFQDWRIKVISEQYPDIDPQKLDYLAKNTSGLFGDFLAQTVKNYIEKGTLTERPYQEGITPVNPSASGVVMERGFHPKFVEMLLQNHHFETFQIVYKPTFERAGLIGFMKDLYCWFRFQLVKIANFNNEEFQRGDSANLQVVGVKK